jgi:hypothetical protein
MLSNVIVIITICLAVFYVGWRIYKHITQKSMGCHCDFSDECSACMVSKKYESGASQMNSGATRSHVNARGMIFHEKNHQNERDGGQSERCD